MIRDTSKESTKKYNYVYKLTLKSNPSIFYIGKRSTNNENDDNYTGSGKALKFYKEKYGKDCFHKEILSYWNSSEEALIEEKKIVTKDLIKDENCLNRIVGGGCFDTLGCKWGKRTKEQNKRNSESHKGIKQSEESKLKKSIAMKKKWADSTYKEQQIKNRKGKNKEHLNKLSQKRAGQVCIIKNNKWKYVDSCDLQSYINDGWLKRGVQKKPSYEEIIKYREQKYTYQKIGDIYNVTESCVRRWKKQYEIDKK